MDEPFDDEEEPFMLRERSDVEVADYDAGFEGGSEGKKSDDTRALHGNVDGLRLWNRQV